MPYKYELNQVQLNIQSLKRCIVIVRQGRLKHLIDTAFTVSQAACQELIHRGQRSTRHAVPPKV